LISDGDISGDDATPTRPLTAAEQAAAAELEARHHMHCEWLDQEYRRLRLDAQACQRSMSRSPRLQSPDEWEAMVTKAADDYRSGLALIDQLGAFGLLDPALAGMLLAIRRGLIEETNAASTDELVLIDMAVVAYANAMRLQSMIGNTALIIESEMFGQPTLQAKWKNQYGGRAEDIRGLAVEEHVARLRDQLLPLVERAHRTARESIEAISRMRQAPAMRVERAEAVSIRLMAPGARSAAGNRLKACQTRSRWSVGDCRDQQDGVGENIHRG
jgi:hypothetical protein